VLRCTGGAVEVEIAPPAACPGCNGACAWRAAQGAARLSLVTPLELAPGEEVSVALPERWLLAAAALLYGLPLALLLLGAVLGFAASGTDFGAAAGGAAGLAAAGLAALRFRSRVERATLDRLEIRRESARHAQAHAL
jgi:sigma-E factor negative regulatory protein RseC